MATVAASTDAAVPDDDDLSEDEAEEPMDPWASYERPPGFSPAASGGRPESALQGSTGRGGQLDTEFAMFEEFVRRREATRPRGRRTSTGDDDDDDQSGRGSAGPPPAWDGTSTFKDYLVRARLWLATTKAKPRSRGPMLLKNLSGTPFDDLKYLARDAAWMNAEDNAEQMLKIMDTKELYGDDAREDMLNTLYKITYALRREKGESYKTFFSRWENCVRRLTEHDVALPAEYLGFLLTMALQLSSEEVKLLMNFTQGKLNQKDVKEWVRVNETNLKLGATGTSRRNNQVLHVEDASDQDDAEDSDSVEVLMNAMESLEDPIQDADADETEPFDEADAKDILSTMIKEHAKGTVKRTFKAVNDAKRAKGLARGYSAARDIGGKFQGGKGGDYVKTGESYRISIDALKRRTRCAHCKKVGHWHRECPDKHKPKAKEANYLAYDNEEAYFLHYLDFRRMSRTGQLESLGKDVADGRFDLTTRTSEPSGCRVTKNRQDCLSESAYRCAALGLPHEIMYVSQHEPIDEDHCATVDTGCQRTAIGVATLERLLRNQQSGLETKFQPETHSFRSVNGISRTSRIACVPTSLGPKGCILRPAVFEEGMSSNAPFLLSLPFLLHCRATLVLDPEQGLKLRLRRYHCEAPLHIGPTGALRVPLDQFSPSMISSLKRAMSQVHAAGVQEVIPSEVHSNHVTSSSPDECSSAGDSRRLCQHGDPEQTSSSPGRSPSTPLLAPHDPAPAGGDRGRGPEGYAEVPGNPRTQTGSSPADDGSGGGPQPPTTGRAEPAGSPRHCRGRLGRPHRRGELGGAFRDPSRGRATPEPTQEDFDGDGFAGESARQPDVRGQVRRDHRSMLLRSPEVHAQDPQGRSQQGAAVLPMSPMEVSEQTLHLLRVVARPRAGHVVECSLGTSNASGQEISESKVATEASTVIPRIDSEKSSSVTGGRERDSGGDQQSPARQPEFYDNEPDNYDKEPDAAINNGRRMPTPERDECRIQCLGEASSLCGLRPSSSPRIHGVPEDLLPGPRSRASTAEDAAEQERRCQAQAAGANEEPNGEVQRRANTPAGLRGVPGVPALPGNEGQELSSQPPEKRMIDDAVVKALPVGQRRRIIGSLKKAERSWTDLLALFEQEIEPSSERSVENKEVLATNVVAEVYNPKRFTSQAPKHSLRAGCAFDLVLGHDLLKPSTQHSVMTYIRHERPGLVIVSPPCGPFSQLNGLLSMFRNRNFKALQRYQEKLREGIKLLKFAVKVCTLCHELGLVFVLEQPWGAKSWKHSSPRRLGCLPRVWLSKADQCEFNLRDALGDFLKKSTGFLTNHEGIARRLSVRRSGQHGHGHIIGKVNGKSKSAAAQVYPPRLLSSILREYSRSIGKAPSELQIQAAEDMLKEDQAHDENYFSQVEYQEVLQNLDQEHLDDGTVPEDVVYYGEGDRHDPIAMGVPAEILEREGEHVLDSDKVVKMQKNVGRLFQPEEGHPARGLPWRSTWVRNGDEPWHLIEDEIRWPELEQGNRPVRPCDFTLTLFKGRANRNSGPEPRHFPGMRPSRLETLVRRAHEGLGHPEINRFVRILRHSKAPEEAIEVARRIRCSVCEAYKLPAPARAAAPPREQYHVNDLVGIDTVHLCDHQNQAIPALNMIDWSTHFQLVIPMAAETAKEARKAYRQWVRFFGPPRKLLLDLGTEFKSDFRRMAEADGSEVLPSSLEAPTQRGLTERAGGLFKDILYKAMSTYDCQTAEHWRELVDVTCMTRNRLLMRAGYSPIQRVIGYTPRLPGGLLTGGEADEMAADLQHIGDVEANRAMRMRQAAAVAFHEVDCSQAIRAAVLAGHRKYHNIEVGQAVYFWRRGAGTTKKTRGSYWHGPGRVLMTALPSTVWISYQGTLVKAAPERVRTVTEEESLSMSGWMNGISIARRDFERIPVRNFIDLTKDNDPIPDEEDEESELIPEDEAGPVPSRRVVRKTGNYAIEHPVPPPGLEPAPDSREEERGPTDERNMEANDELADQTMKASGSDLSPPEASLDDQHHDAAASSGNAGGTKREPQDLEEPPGKRHRVELLEVYHMRLENLSRMRQRKESRAKDFRGPDAGRLQRAILKEINTNLETGAYKLLPIGESKRVERDKADKIMESRYVLTKKPLEPSDVPKARSEDLLLEEDGHGPQKAKCRHVMKGYSEADALDVESSTPQVSRDSMVFVAQVLASMGWTPGFLDFTQAFHSGDDIGRELYCRQPPEGIPGADPQQLLKLLKTCYGLTDGPYAWYQHLLRRLTQDYGYRASLADPCVFYKYQTDQLEGIIGLATDDMIHGGSEAHWKVIETIAKEYKLGKNQTGAGRFTGKDIRMEKDGSITINQSFYVDEKVSLNPIARKRKQQRYSRCTKSEVEQLRSQLGVLSWLAKETRCDLAGRVSLLQQCFPDPKVMDLIEGNKIAEEAIKYKQLGIRVMPIPWSRLRVSVVTDASWGNAKDGLWLEDAPEDSWEETEDCWIRHHRAPRRTTFHPGASEGGPDLHEIQPRRQSEYFIQGDKIRKDILEDQWCDPKGIRVLAEETWIGRTIFWKADSNESQTPAVKIHSSLLQLQQLSSQGGQIVIYHDKDLAQSGAEAPTTLASWKSFRLKRKVVDTLAAEGQALQGGIGSVHWHRLMVLEAFYGMITPERWREEAARLPFIAAVDSKSLYDAANKCASTTAYVSDKRTAIDLAVIKADLKETSGKIRWIDTRAMLADPLTKQHPASYLRFVMDSGRWSIVEEGTALLRKSLERSQEKACFSMYLMVWETEV